VAHRIAEHTNAAIQDTAPNVPTTNIAMREILVLSNGHLRKLRGLRRNPVKHQAVEILDSGLHLSTATKARTRLCASPTPRMSVLGREESFADVSLRPKADAGETSTQSLTWLDVRAN